MDLEGYLIGPISSLVTCMVCLASNWVSRAFIWAQSIRPCVLLDLNTGFRCILILYVSLGVGSLGYAKFKAGEGPERITGLPYFELGLQLFYFESIIVYLGLYYFI